MISRPWLSNDPRINSLANAWRSGNQDKIIPGKDTTLCRACWICITELAHASNFIIIEKGEFIFLLDDPYRTAYLIGSGFISIYSGKFWRLKTGDQRDACRQNFLVKWACWPAMLVHFVWLTHKKEFPPPVGYNPREGHREFIAVWWT